MTLPEFLYFLSWGCTITAALLMILRLRSKAQ